MPTTPDAPLSADHDHSACILSALKDANAHCDKLGLRLTPLRQQILEIIWQTHKPVGAYNIMHSLAEASFRDQVAPPTVYRSLEFLLKHRLIHRVHTLNAFIGRSHPSAPGCEALLICSDCGYACEVPNRSVQQAINLSANEHRFTVEEQVLEVIGLCQHCRAKSDSEKAKA